MHPPLYKPHPLCKQEVENLVRCHEENPFMKFMNACGDSKIALDQCFREEKKLRVKLNKRVANPYADMEDALEARAAAKAVSTAAASAAPPAPASGAGGP